MNQLSNPKKSAYLIITTNHAVVVHVLLLVYFYFESTSAVFGDVVHGHSIQSRRMIHVARDFWGSNS